MPDSLSRPRLHGNRQVPSTGGSRQAARGAPAAAGLPSRAPPRIAHPRGCCGGWRGDQSRRVIALSPPASGPAPARRRRAGCARDRMAAEAAPAAAEGATGQGSGPASHQGWGAGPISRASLGPSCGLGTIDPSRPALGCLPATGRAPLGPLQRRRGLGAIRPRGAGGAAIGGWPRGSRGPRRPGWFMGLSRFPRCPRREHRGAGRAVRGLHSLLAPGSCGPRDRRDKTTAISAVVIRAGRGRRARGGP
jgi:hypothetical protein